MKISNEQLQKDIQYIATYKAEGVAIQDILKRIDTLLQVRYKDYDYIVTPVIENMDFLDVALGRKLLAYTYLMANDICNPSGNTQYLITLFERETEGKSCYHQKNIQQN